MWDKFKGKIHSWKCTNEIDLCKNKIDYDYKDMWIKVEGKIHMKIYRGNKHI